MASASVSELEQEIAATRSRLNGTIDRIQDKLTVSGIVDEVMGQAGVPRLATGHDLVFSLLRRHPVPLMLVAAGLGFAVYQMNRRTTARAALDDRSREVDIPVRLPPPEDGPIYAPDLALRSPSLGGAEPDMPGRRTHRLSGDAL